MIQEHYVSLWSFPKIPWISNGGLHVVRGHKQFTLLNLTFTLPIFSVSMNINGKRKIEHSEWIKILAKQYKNETDKVKKNKLREELYQHFEQALKEGQQSNFLVNCVLFDKLVNLFELDRKRFAHLNRNQNEKAYTIKINALSAKYQHLNSKARKHGKKKFFNFIKRSLYDTGLKALLLLSALMISTAGTAIGISLLAIFFFVTPVGWGLGLGFLAAALVVGAFVLAFKLRENYLNEKIQAANSEADEVLDSLNKSFTLNANINNDLSSVIDLSTNTLTTTSSNAFTKIAGVLTDIVEEHPEIRQVEIIATEDEEKSLQETHGETITQLKNQLDKNNTTEYTRHKVKETILCLDALGKTNPDFPTHEVITMFFSEANSNLADYQQAKKEGDVIPELRLNFLDFYEPGVTFSRPKSA
jgi:hypothetical protein